MGSKYENQYIFFRKKKKKGINCPIENCRNTNDVFQIMHSTVCLEQKAEEYMYLLAFNERMHLCGLFEISHGTVSHTVCTSREIYIRALLCGTTQIILVHNHPSGDLCPSEADIITTKYIRDAGKLLNIPLRDHVIVSREGVFSMLEEKIIEF